MAEPDVEIRYPEVRPSFKTWLGLSLVMFTPLSLRFPVYKTGTLLLPAPSFLGFPRRLAFATFLPSPSLITGLIEEP